MLGKNNILDIYLHKLAEILNNRNIIFFDIETQYLFTDIMPKWRTLTNNGRRYLLPSICKKLKLAVAGVLKFDNNQPYYQYYTETNISNLEKQLLLNDKIIGYNLLNFDYHVLSAYFSDTTINLITKNTVDIMLIINDEINQYLSLNDLGHLNLDIGKFIDTIKIPELWRAGKHNEVISYLQRDLDILASIFYLGLQKTPITYIEKNYGEIIGEKEVVLDFNNILL